MAGLTANSLLGADDPTPFGLFNAEGTSPFLLIGDHAGSALPKSLEDLGLAPSDLERHIAIDIGVFGLGHALASLLDAPFLHQVYSRLVIDCNRHPARPDAIPAISDHTPIPGNASLDMGARTARTVAIRAPYHAKLSAMLDERQAAGRPTILLSLHSFTPQMDGIARPWDVGVLHSLGETGFAHALRDALAEQSMLNVGDNVPYAMDETDYTVPHHAFARNLPYAEIEVRQDLIGSSDAQATWAGRLSTAAQWAAERTCGS
ncbi:n-formylglutamate amidohydrolase [Novosphingobium sp. Rr 2-17]|uniref:N-formylglutamate amidohydrolase n=1 Tax=Novosphingobium sp. Rr 2-17 TaxID=555793 RepID=UPI0002697EBD|nr:N-formylglutamate amidohydrolase [Novosphingobium sp. Rr 2-17]EIZ78992.1 n-formylglutamate amidohydrolase [Novosphingobium sp. Rr 2-17]